MEFIDIQDTDSVSEGEYVYHMPSKTIVLCGSFSRVNNTIQALKSGRLLEDEIANFQKIEIPRAEMYRSGPESRGCGGCKKA